MNDQQIDAAVRECVERIESGDYNTNAVIRILVRRVRDAEQERCAVKLEEIASKLFPHAAWPYKDAAAAIRAPRTEGQHGQG